MKDLFVVDLEEVVTVAVVAPVGSVVISKVVVPHWLASRRVAPPVVATSGRDRRSLPVASVVAAVAIVADGVVVVVAVAVDSQSRFSMDLSSRSSEQTTAGFPRRLLPIWKSRLNPCRVS